MNCPSCGASMELATGEDYYRCSYCLGVYVPEDNEDGVRILGQNSELACPVCPAVPLVHAAIAHQRFLYCERCHGMLVAMGGFLILLEQLRSRREGAGVPQSAANPRDLERTLHCPQCRQKMDTHFYEGPGNVVIDSCSPCSLDWLDCGELFRIVRAPDRSYDEPYGAPEA